MPQRRRRSGRVPEAANVIAIAPAQPVPAVTKAVAMIRFINERGPAGASLSEISDRLGITRSHCFNILRTLAGCGWLLHDPQSRIWRLSSGLAVDTTSALFSRPYLDVVRTAVEQLSSETGLPCTVCEPVADGSFLVVHTVATPEPFVSSVPVGYRFPRTIAAQLKAMLAWLPDKERAAALENWRPVRHTRTTIVDPARMLEDLRETRRRGYARSLGEFVEGFTTVALPVYDRAGDIVLVVSCAGLTEGFAAREPGAAAALVRCVNAIHAAIDGRPPVDFPRP